MGQISCNVQSLRYAGKSGCGGRNNGQLLLDPFYHFSHSPAHSWFISAVDSNELCPVKPVQMNQAKYENYENEGAIGGHDVF